MRKIKDVLRLKLDAEMQIAAALAISNGVVPKYVGLDAAAAWIG